MCVWRGRVCGCCVVVSTKSGFGGTSKINNLHYRCITEAGWYTGTSPNQQPNARRRAVGNTGTHSRCRRPQLSLLLTNRHANFRFFLFAVNPTIQHGSYARSWVRIWNFSMCPAAKRPSPVRLPCPRTGAMPGTSNRAELAVRSEYNDGIGCGHMWPVKMAAVCVRVDIPC